MLTALLTSLAIRGLPARADVGSWAEPKDSKSNVGTSTLPPKPRVIPGSPNAPYVWPSDMPDVPRFYVNPIKTEIGYRLGFVQDIRQPMNYPNSDTPILPHYEGKILMGYASAPSEIMDQHCLDQGFSRLSSHLTATQRRAHRIEIENLCRIDENPWPFTILDGKIYEQYGGGFTRLNDLSARPVLVYYFREAHSPLNIFAIWSTKNVYAVFADASSIVKRLWRVDPNFPAPKYYLNTNVGSLFDPRVNPENGRIPSGRVVKATLDNKFFKTYEITVQQTIGNNNWRRLSVDNKEMFDHIVMAMRTGWLVSITYTELWGVEAWVKSWIGYTTPYRVASIEILSPKKGKPPQISQNPGLDHH